MSKTKSKILAIFLMVLFFQRAGAALFLKVRMAEDVYKEVPFSISSASKDKVCMHSVFCSNNRVYEISTHAIIEPLVQLPPQEIQYHIIQYRPYWTFVHIGIFLKRSALRGPPYVC